MGGLPHGELDGVRGCVHEGGDSLGQVFDTGEEGGFVEKAVIDRDVEAAAGLGIEEAVEAGGFHGQKVYRVTE